MIDERRCSERETVWKDAVVSYDHERVLHICRIVNQSDIGALIKLDQSCFLPENVELIIPDEQFVATCRVVWARHSSYGLRYTNGPFIIEADGLRPVFAPDEQAAGQSATKNFARRIWQRNDQDATLA